MCWILAVTKADYGKKVFPKTMTVPASERSLLSSIFWQVVLFNVYEIDTESQVRLVRYIKSGKSMHIISLWKFAAIKLKYFSNAYFANVEAGIQLRHRCFDCVFCARAEKRSVTLATHS